MFRAAVTAAFVIVVACGSDLGPPRVRPLATRDGSAALRGSTTPRSPRIANYRIAAKLDASTHRLVATQTVTWTNTGTLEVTSLPFHLYLNAFKNEDSLYLRSARGNAMHAGPPETWGWIQLDSVKIGGAELVRTVTRPDPRDKDETVAVLPLPQPLAPGATIEVAFAFTAQLPELVARTGFKGEFHLVGQWFPKIGVLVNDAWECHALQANTEFFADFGTYDVSLTVPETYVVAATGVLADAREDGGGTRTYTYHAEDVHDFAWMADPYMETMSGQAKLGDGTVEVRVVHRPAQKDFARRHLAAAIGALERYSAWFVPYPWSIMTVIDVPVDAQLTAGGMEYPTFVTTMGDSALVRPGLRFPEYVTVHEVGHNWFQGILASNEPIEPWLDEGVNEWANAKVMTELFGGRGSGVDWMGWQADIAHLVRAVQEDPTTLPAPIATAAAAFVDSDAYADTAYGAAAVTLSTLENTVGPARFAAAMKKYAETWQFRHPRGDDLFEVLGAELGQDLAWFYQPAFHQVGGVELALRTARCLPAHPSRGVFGEGSARTLVTTPDAPPSGTFDCEVIVTNTGPVRVPVEVQLTFADGSIVPLVWDPRGPDEASPMWHRFVEKRSVPLTEVWIDPAGKIPLARPMTHRYRLLGDGDAAMRAGAWFAAGAQTLMGAIGP